MNEAVVKQTTHTLLTCYYSYLFSLFDPSGINFEKISEGLVADASQKAIEVRQLILDHWEKLKTPMTQIRNNIGFHGAVKEKGKALGYSAYFNIHPLSSEYIMTLFRVFFRLMELFYESKEQIARPAEDWEIEALLEQAQLTKRMIDSSEDKFVIEPILAFATFDENADVYIH